MLRRRSHIDMCNGPLFKNILLYTLPIIVTSVLQLLFNTMDLLVVGWFCGSTSVGAVGSTGSLINLMVNLFMGLSIGVSVTVAQGIGAGNHERVSQTVHTAFPVAVICSILVTAVGMTCSRTFLEWMGNPQDTIDLAALYMRIYFGGTIGNMIYNFGAAILRAAGDTVRPLIFLSIAGVLNVILNLIFVCLFHMDVAGVALATAISQCVSAALVVMALLHRHDMCRLDLRKLAIDKTALKRILTIGVPSGIQGSLFSISNVIIQSAVNSFETAAVVGSAAASNIEGYVYTCQNAFAQTAMNFTGQNTGARQFKRVRKVWATCLLAVTVVGVVLGGLVNLLGRPLLGIYITDSAEAIEYGLIKLLWICLPYFVCGLMEVTSYTLRGLGKSLLSMIISVIGVCGFRLAWIFTVFQIPAFHTLESLFFSYPLSWTATLLVGMAILLPLLRKLQRQSGEQ